MKTRIFQNEDRTYCVRQGCLTWLFSNAEHAKWFYRAMLRKWGNEY